MGTASLKLSTAMPKNEIVTIKKSNLSMQVKSGFVSLPDASTTESSIRGVGKYLFQPLKRYLPT